ncbi:MAG: sugar ABC transporter permease [Chloroflexi bacterium HGW-Chloroflexi-10]|nr:MAG: sugar ABC transporter permease [Chloroflexi bacterium HGW-Chloroflexi-10]
MVQIVVIALCLLWTLPSFGVFVSSFRLPDQIALSGWWKAFETPLEFSQWTLENYAEVLTSGGLANSFLNSLIVTIPSTLLPIMISAIAAYAFAWIKFPGREILFAIVVGLIVMPIQMALIPVLRMYNQLGWTGTFMGIWLAHTGFAIPMAVYLLYNFISQIPRDLIEAATIDGATHYQIFSGLVLRLSLPAIASFAVFEFLWIWNDLLVALVFLGTRAELAVITARLTDLIGTRGEAWYLLTAGAFISMLAPLVVFFGLQRFFVRGMLAGAVKE